MALALENGPRSGVEPTADKAAKEVQAFFKASTYTRLGDGRRALFWEDRWIDGQDVATIAPYLHLRVPQRVRRKQTVQEGLQGRAWVRCISGGLSVHELTDYLHLWATVNDCQLIDQPDQTIWRWTTDGKYSVKSAYKMMHTGSIAMTGHRLIWKTWGPLRVNIFLWLAVKRRHWTGDRRARHGLEERKFVLSL